MYRYFLRIISEPFIQYSYEVLNRPISTCASCARTSPIGINPRPASASRALLRLTPCYRAYRRPTRGGTSGTPDSLVLTGGEYKTRERIHRGVADPRLLAIPTSWGRVADPNPN
jgi:hypothetical protein